MKYLLIILTLCLSACVRESSIPIDYSTKKILVIGDSIAVGEPTSIGYGKKLNENAYGIEFINNIENAETSTNGVKKINKWLDAAGNVDLVTFNHGIWDVLQKFKTNPESYINNLKYEISQIRKRGLRVVFITTSYIPPDYNRNAVNYEDVVIYNMAAIKLMNELNVPVIDNYELTKSIDDKFLIFSDGHRDLNYIEEAYEIMADHLFPEIIKYIK